MPKKSKNYTIDEKVVEQVATMADTENRSQSNMFEILVKEALAARKKKK